MDEDSTTQEPQSQRMLGLGLTLSDDSSKHDRKGHLGFGFDGKEKVSKVRWSRM